MCLKYLTYDPNYNYDEGSEDEGVNTTGGADMELDYDDDDDEENDDYSDDDDMSWKVKINISFRLKVLDWQKAIFFHF